jgi:hypothetical protein
MNESITVLSDTDSNDNRHLLDYQLENRSGLSSQCHYSLQFKKNFQTTTADHLFNVESCQYSALFFATFAPSQQSNDFESTYLYPGMHGE